MAALPSLRQLHYLVEVADKRNFRAAAEASFVTQSTLSAGIKELETLLGVELVERDPRGVRLTPAGEEVARRARTLLAAAQDLVETAHGAGAPLSGLFRLGVIPTIAPFLLSGVLSGLRKAYPELKLYLREDQTDPLLEQLHAGRLDVLALALPYDCGNVETALLFKDRFSLGLRRDHRLASAKHVRPKEIESETLLLLQEGHCLRGHALSACRIGDKAHADAFEGTSLPTLVQMVDNGLGVTLLPQLALDAGVLKGTEMVARPVEVDRPERDIALVWRKGTARREEFQLLAREIARLAK